MDSEVVLVAGSLDVLAVPASGGGRRLFVRAYAAGAARGGRPDPERSRGGGGAAGEGEAPPVLRGEPAQPVRDTDICAGRLSDPAAAARGRGAFFRGLRRELGGRALPYPWVPEWHPGGHGLHVHFAVGRYVRPAADPRGVGPRARPHQAARRPAGRLGRARGGALGARYLAKYAGKDSTASGGRGAAPIRGRAGVPAGAGAAAAGSAEARCWRTRASRWAASRRGSGARRPRRAGRGRQRCGARGLTEQRSRRSVRARSGRRAGAGASGEGAGSGDPAAGGGLLRPGSAAPDGRDAGRVEACCGRGRRGR